MPTLVLNNNDLLKMAQNKEVSTQYWAKIMSDTRKSRTFFNEQFNEFQKYRYWTELAVKGAVTLTLGVGLFLAAPASLLYGAALTLGLSSLVYWAIKQNSYSVETPEATDVNITNFNKDKWEKVRADWTVEAQNQNFSEKQKALQVNMTRVGMALVIGFATFTAITSGLAISLAISTVLFSSSLFHRFSDDTAPYLEKEELPSLTM